MTNTIRTTYKQTTTDELISSLKIKNELFIKHPTFMNHDIITNDEIKEDCVFTGIKDEF